MHKLSVIILCLKISVIISLTMSVFIQKIRCTIHCERTMVTLFIITFGTSRFSWPSYVKKKKKMDGWMEKTVGLSVVQCHEAVSTIYRDTKHTELNFTDCGTFKLKCLECLGQLIFSPWQQITTFSSASSEILLPSTGK